MKPSQLAAANIKSAAEKIQAILFTGEGDARVMKSSLSAQEQTELQSLESQLAQHEAAFKTARNTEDLAERAASALGEINKGANRIPLDASEKAIAARASARAAGDVQYEGSLDAGATWVMRRKAMDALEVAYEEGHLGMDSKQLEVTASASYKQVFRRYVRKGLHGLGSMDLKTLQEGVDSQGGFLVPEDVLNFIIQKVAAPTRVSGMVQTLSTARDQMVISRVNYTADDKYTTGIRSTWTGEIPSSSTVHRVTDPVFGQLRIPVNTNMMSLPITLDMIEDSAFPLISWASSKFSETIDLLKDDMIINGDGVGKPAGFLYSPGGTNQPAVVVSGHASQITADGIINLGYSLPEQYDENARYLFNKTNTAKAIATLKDSNNRYLFGMGLQDSGLAGGRPTELNGYPYSYSAFMPDIAANAFPVLFGDFRSYILLNRVGFSIQVLDQPYAESNQTVLLGRVRFGGQVAEPWRVKIQKIST